MNLVNLAEVRTGYSGTRFCQLVEHHLCSQSQDQRMKALPGTVALLPEAARSLATGFVDRWNTRTNDSRFWQRDTASVFDEIIEDAQSVLRPIGLAADNEAAFYMFNLVVLSYACMAYDRRKMREFIGIADGGFPWPSAMALLYPLGATIYIAAATPARLPMIAGYGLANLGYLLFAAGIWKGSFRVLGLKNRWQVFGSAIASFLLGSVLCNIGA